MKAAGPADQTVVYGCFHLVGTDGVQRLSFFVFDLELVVEDGVEAACVHV